METKIWLVETLHFVYGLTRKCSECTEQAVGWTAWGSGLGRGKSYLLQHIQTGSVAHRTLYLNFTEFFPGG